VIFAFPFVEPDIVMLLVEYVVFAGDVTVSANPPAPVNNVTLYSSGVFVELAVFNSIMNEPYLALSVCNWFLQLHSPNPAADSLNYPKNNSNIRGTMFVLYFALLFLISSTHRLKLR